VRWEIYFLLHLPEGQQGCHERLDEQSVNNQNKIAMGKPDKDQQKSKNPNYNWDEANEISPEDLQAAADYYDKIRKAKDEQWIQEGRAHSEDGRIIDLCQR